MQTRIGHYYCPRARAIGPSGRATAAGNVSSPIGPDGGSITALAQAPSQPDTLYAGTTDGGVFRSTDGGANWTAASDGLPLGGYNRDRVASILSLTVDPQNPATVYAITDGLYKSSDGGAHWQLSLQENVASVAIDPSEPAVVYTSWSTVQGSAAPFGGGSSYQVGSISKSVDGGGSWQVIYHKEDIAYAVSAVMLDPHNHATIYATQGARSLKSTDGGATWQNLGDVIPGNVGYTLTKAILAPTTPAAIYVTRYGGIAKSSDGGTNWRPINAGLPLTASGTLAINDIGFAPGSFDTLYAATDAGLYLSTDGGASWHSSGHSPEAASVQTVLATSTALLVGTALGVYTSSDDGATWMSSIHGLTNTDITTVLIDSTMPTTLYAGTAHGVYHSTDSGLHWMNASTGVVTESVRTIVQAPAPAGTLYALTESSDRLYTSSDGGVNWTLVAEPAPIYTQAIVLDPQTPTTLYAIANSVYKSIDGGAHWTKVFDQLNNNYGTSLAVDPTTPDTLFVGGYAIYKSTDNGTSWITTTQGIDFQYSPYTFASTFAVTTLLVSSQAHTVYAGSTQGVYISNDGGASWHSSNASLPPEPTITALTQDTQNPATLYASVAGWDVFRSIDGGAHWVATGSGLNSGGVHSLAVNPLDATHIYAGTTGNGIVDVQQIDRLFSTALPIVVK